MEIKGAKSKLEKECQDIINSHIQDYDTPDQFFNDLFYGGCASGIIGELVYYVDTLKFYKRHKKEIQGLVRNFTQDCGCGLEVLNGWDKYDMFAEETTNQNILAWFGFEETARSLAYMNDIEV